MSEQRALTHELEGPAAPPRKNGELVFGAPWESRVFGLALVLHEAGRFEWDEFRERLIAAIARWEQRREPDEAYSYYARWLEALEQLLAEKELCSTAQLDDRARELAARPHGHDH
jgi:nitrile hydratase accessory protein